MKQRYDRNGETGDFHLYYFRNQYAWNLFPEASREKIKDKLVSMAESRRKKHPKRDLTVPFWPKNTLAGFRGMNDYAPPLRRNLLRRHLPLWSFSRGDPREDSLSHGVHEGENGGVPRQNFDGGTGEEDIERVCRLIPRCEIRRFACGHGIHIERPKELVQCLFDLLT